MGPRYTKAIILLVVGSPVLAAGIIIDNSLETNIAQSSTVTIARLMIAVGACMVAVGIFIVCIILTTNKKEEPNAPSPSTDIQLHRVRVTTAPHSQSQRRGVQLVTYSPLPEAQGFPYPQSARFNKAPLVNSPAVHFQTSAVTSTPVNHNNASQLTRTSAPTGSVSQLPNAIPTQNGGQHANPSTVPNQIPSVPAAHCQSYNISETKSQRSNTSEAKSQRSNISVAKSQRSNTSENKSQRSNMSENKSQRSSASEGKSQRSSASEGKSQRSHASETKSQRSNLSESKSQRSNITEAKSKCSSSSEVKSHRTNASETKNPRASSSDAKTKRSSSSEAKNQRSSSSDTKNQRINSSENKNHRSSSSETKNQRSNPSPALNKRSNSQGNPGKRVSTPENSNPSLQQHNSGPLNATHQRHLSSESLVYPVSAIDMAKLLTAAKKVMEPKTFDDIAKAYSIVYSSSRPTSQVDMPTFDYSVPVQGPLSSCSSSSAGQLSAQSGACGLLPPTQEQVSLENTLPLGNSPSAPPYQEQPPEFDPPPYSP